MRLTLGLAVLLVAFWLVLSGHVAPVPLASGLLSVAFVVWLTRRMRIVDRESLPVHLVPRLPWYLPWLVKEILRSSLSVTRQVWSPRLRLRPAVAVAPTPDLPELSQVIYANSITLTPGTLSLSVHDEGIEVHSLHASGIGALRTGGMLDRVWRLEVR